MLLFSAYFIALWLSIFSFLCWLSDAAIHHIFLTLSLLCSALIAAVLVSSSYKKNRAAFANPDKSKPLICLLFFCLLILPSLPNCFPLYLDWDGANHFALINFFRFFDSTVDIPKLQYDLRGGNLATYPWGFHAFIAAISNLFTIDPFLIVHPALCFISIMIVGIWLEILSPRYKSKLIVFGCAIFLVFLFPVAFSYNYWSQIVGLFLLSAVICSSIIPERKLHYVFQVCLSVGLLLVYPLYFPIALLACLVIPVIRSQEIKINQKFVILFFISLITALAIWPNQSEHLNRLFSRGGPGIYEKNIAGPWLILLLHFAALFYYGLRLKRNKKDDYAILVLLGICSMALAFFLEMNPYWTSKLLHANLFLFVPMIAEAISKISKIEKSNKVKTIAVYCAYFFIFISPISLINIDSIKNLKPALSPGAYQIIKWLNKNTPQNVEVYVSTFDYQMFWFQALMLPHSSRIFVDMQSLTNSGADVPKMAEVSNLLIKNPDAWIVSKWFSPRINNRYKIIHAEKEWKVYERIKEAS